MKIKTLILMLLTLFAVTSCGDQQRNIPPVTNSPNIENLALTPAPTKTSSSGDLTTFTPTFTPTTKIPEGTRIAFSGGIKGIFEMSLPSGLPRPIVLSPGGNVLYFSPSWSPDGNKIVYEQDSKVYVLNRDGSDFHILKNEQVKIQSSPAWSPDGEHIAYVSDNSLFVVNADGKDLQQLGKLSSIVYFPAWSSDGKQLAFLASSAGEHNPLNIFLIDRDGKNLRAITEAIAGESQLAWSPDGSKIAFRSFEDCGDINVLNLKTGSITNLTNTPHIVEQDPVWSPDGNYIVFSKASYSPCEQDKVFSYYGGELYIMNAHGQDVAQLTFEQGGLQPSWWPVVILQPNWKYSVTKAGSNLNIRESPSTAAKSLVQLQQGAIFTALEGPIDADKYQWWHIRTSDGIEGWCVDVPGWFMFESAS